MGAAIEATPISRSLTASAQPRARTVASSARSGVGIGDRVRGEPGERRGGEEAPRGRARARWASSTLPELVQCAGTPAAGLGEQPQRVRALQPVDVDHLVPVEHADLGGLAGLLAQLGEHRRRRRRAGPGAPCTASPSSNTTMPEPVAAGARVLLDQPLGDERGQQPVDVGLAQPEPARQLRDPERLLAGEERLEQPRGVAHGRQGARRSSRRPRARTVQSRRPPTARAAPADLVGVGAGPDPRPAPPPPRRAGRSRGPAAPGPAAARPRRRPPARRPAARGPAPGCGSSRSRGRPRSGRWPGRTRRAPRGAASAPSRAGRSGGRRRW